MSAFDPIADISVVSDPDEVSERLTKFHFPLLPAVGSLEPQPALSVTKMTNEGARKFNEKSI